MRVLTAREAEIVETIAETFFPREDGEGIGADEARVVRYVDGFLSKLPFFERLKLRALFQLFEFGIAAKLMDPTARFTRASLSDRESFLESWERSDNHAFRSIYAALRSVVTLGYMDDTTVQEAMGDLRRDELIRDELASVTAHAAEAVRVGAAGLANGAATEHASGAEAH